MERAIIMGLLKIAKGKVAVMLLATTGVVLLITSRQGEAFAWRIAMNRAKLVPGSATADIFASPPEPLHQRFYIFSLTNYNEMTEGARPRVVELGPYVFRINITRRMAWNEDLVKFRQTAAFDFDPELSRGLLEDEVVTVNPVVLQLIRLRLGHLLGDRTLFFKTTVGELLYGISDSLLESDSVRDHLRIPVRDGRIGSYLGTSGMIDEEFEVYSGVAGIQQLNNIVSFNGNTTNRYYGSDCNKLEGTNGQLYPPFQDPPDFVVIMIPQLCKPWKLYLEGEDLINELPVNRFIGTGIFTSTGDQTIDRCLEAEPTGLNGTFEASRCHNGLPVIFSMPHFSDADVTLAASVGGMRPTTDKYGLYIDVYPMLGFVVDIRLQVQVNLKLTRGPNDGNLTDVIFPILWHETSFEPASIDATANILYGRMEKLRWSITDGLAAASGLCFAKAAGIVGYNLYKSCCCRRRKKDRKEETEDEPPVSYQTGQDEVVIEEGQ